MSSMLCDWLVAVQYNNKYLRNLNVNHIGNKYILVLKIVSFISVIKTKTLFVNDMNMLRLKDPLATHYWPGTAQ